MSGPRGSRRSRIATFVAAALVVVAGLGVVAAPARAHTILERSEPAANAVLAASPRVVTLQFSEEIEPGLSTIRLADASGRVLASRVARATSRELALRTRTLGRGTYVVSWTVLASDDGHVGKGSVVFAVGRAVDPDIAAAADEGPAFPVEGALFRWLNLAVVVLLLGSLVVAGIVLPPGHPRTPAVRRRVLGWATVCALQGVLVGIGLLLSQSAAVAHSPDAAWRIVSGTRWGALWSMRLALLVALVALLLLRNTHGRRGTALFAAAAALAVALVGVQALMGHAAGVPTGEALAVLADAAHLLAAGIWVGGLAALVVALWPLTRLDGLTRAAFARFGAAASASVAALAVTGVYGVAHQVASPDALLTTAYGLTLVAKVALALVLATLGFASALLFDPELADRVASALGRAPGWRPVSRSRLRRLLVAEVGAGLAVLLAAGILTALPPARGPEFARAPRDTPSTVTRSVDDLLVTLSVRPNRPGENVVDVRAVSTLRPPPPPVTRVLLRFADAAGDGEPWSAVATEREPGLYRSTGVELPAAGRLALDALVQRPGRPDSTVALDWIVPPSVEPRPVVVSDAPLRPLLTWTAAILLAAALVAGGLRLGSRRRATGGARRGESRRRAPHELEPEPPA